MCRSGRTSSGSPRRARCRGSRRIRPPACDVVALGDEAAEEAVRVRRQRARTPSAETPIAFRAHHLADRRRRRATACSRLRSRGPACRRARRPRCRRGAPSAPGRRRRKPHAVARSGPSSPPADRVVGRSARARARRVREHVHLRDAARRHGLIVFANAASSSVGKPTITSVVRLKSSSALDPPAELPDRVAPPHGAQDAVVAGLERDVEVRRDHRRLAHGRDQLGVTWFTSIDESRSRSSPSIAPAFANEAGEREPSLAIAEAAEVDTGQDDLAVPLRDAAPDLGSTAAAERLRVPPRTSGITQNAHENEQPSWILTNARTRSSRWAACTQPIAPTSPATVSATSSLRRATTGRWREWTRTCCRRGWRRNPSRRRGRLCVRPASRPGATSRPPRW